MADKKISALTGATTPLDGTEVLPIVQSGATVKVANNDLRPKQIQSNATSGVLQVAGPASAATRVMTTPDANFTVARTDAAQSLTGDQTLATGNIIQGTAAKGINFTANTPAAGMTSQLLNWYEEGNYSPTITALTGTITTSSGTVYYTRTGRQVTLNYTITITTNGTGAGQLIVSTPIACAYYGGGSGKEIANTGLPTSSYSGNSSSIFTIVFSGSGLYPGANGNIIRGCHTYLV